MVPSPNDPNAMKSSSDAPPPIFKPGWTPIYTAFGILWRLNEDGPHA